MPRRRRDWIRLPLYLAVCCGAARAEPPRHEVLQLDAARSQATFTVKVLWLIGLKGEFGAVQGSVAIDHFRGTARVEATLATDDLRMRSQHYQTWARSAEFFDAEHFPKIDFASTAFPLVRLRTGGTLDGWLTLRGIARPVQFRILPSDCPRPLTGACSMRADGRISRGDFGMHSLRGSLAEKVSLRLRIFVVPAPDPP
ncbi:MAG: YceI family protein [Proteobacteria bacterium]|nr:YceI family protein [Pseudomonadota bacterium]